MKFLGALIVLLMVCSSSPTLKAQTTLEWVTFSLGEQFTIQMPRNHVVNSLKDSFEQFSVDGRVYTATEDGVDYTVWSLVNEGKLSNGPLENEAYLDACADLVWESLLKPLRDQLPKDRPVIDLMIYQRELETSKLQLGREYSVTLEHRTGLVHFYVAGRRIYFLTVLNPRANLAASQRFLNSVRLKTPALPVGATVLVDPNVIQPSPQVHSGGGIGPGRGENPGGEDRKVITGTPPTEGGGTDYNGIFSGREVTTRARVLTKLEPSYTESARKYGVQGTVVLRAVFSNTGEVTNIRAVKRLPHGLTERAILAAREIKFIPSMKDERAVSMHIQLEYNFNLY